MAAGYLPTPGKVVDGEEVGPCIEPCKHRDCNRTRQMAATSCWVCGEPIGYETAFVQRNSHAELAHEVCALKEAGR